MRSWDCEVEGGGLWFRGVLWGDSGGANGLQSPRPAKMVSSPLPTGSQETLDPPTLFPPPVRRRPPEKDPAVERPKTLEFAPRPRPSPSRSRLDPWKLVSFGRTHRASPGSGCGTQGEPGRVGGEPPDPASARQTLLDIDMEGQSKDSTVPLCGGALHASSLDADMSH